MAVEIDATQLAMLSTASTSAASAGPTTGSPSRIVQAAVPWTSPLRRDLQSPMGGDDHRCEWRDRAEALEVRLAQVEATLEKLQRHQFGARSEKMPAVAEVIRDPARAEASRIAAQQKRRENAEKKRQLVTRTIEHKVRDDQKACPKCGGHDFSRLGGGERTEVYELVTARVERQVHVREKLRCRCGETILTADPPAKVYDKARFGPTFMAQVVVSKCADSLPLYRQAKAYRRVGVQVDDSTLGELFSTASPPRRSRSCWRSRGTAEI
jgi:transposase